MEVQIRNIPAQRLAYVRHLGPYREVAAAWEALCRWAGPRGLLGPSTRFLGISYDDPSITPEDRIRYDACVDVPAAVGPEGAVGIHEIPATPCAVLHFEGPGEEIHTCYAHLYGEWMPVHGWEPADLPCWEHYLSQPGPDGRFNLDIYLPIRPAGA